MKMSVRVVRRNKKYVQTKIQAPRQYGGIYPPPGPRLGELDHGRN